MRNKMIIEINLKYSSAVWEPTISLKFRAKFLLISQKQADNLGLYFYGEQEFYEHKNKIYFEPIFIDVFGKKTNGSAIELKNKKSVKKIKDFLSKKC